MEIKGGQQTANELLCRTFGIHIQPQSSITNQLDAKRPHAETRHVPEKEPVEGGVSVALTTISLPGMKVWILASIDDSLARRPISTCKRQKKKK